MRDNYIGRIFTRNWRLFLGLFIIIFVLGFVLKNVGEIPYENQHLQQSSLSLKFEHQGQTIRGILYAFYWVETDPEIVGGMSEYELDDYLFENGRLDLTMVRDDFIKLMKNYSPAELKEKYYSDYEYFKIRDFYYVKSDSRLEKFIKKHDFNISLPYNLKKVFFIYLDEDAYEETEKN